MDKPVADPDSNFRGVINWTKVQCKEKLNLKMHKWVVEPIKWGVMSRVPNQNCCRNFINMEQKH